MHFRGDISVLIYRVHGLSTAFKSLFTVLFSQCMLFDLFSSVFFFVGCLFVCFCGVFFVVCLGLFVCSLFFCILLLTLIGKVFLVKQWSKTQPCGVVFLQDFMCLSMILSPSMYYDNSYVKLSQKFKVFLIFSGNTVSWGTAV